MSQQVRSPLMQPRQPQSLEWFVVVETGSLAGQRFPIRTSGGPLTLGRDGKCTIQFDPEQERVVGRRHAHIEMRSDGVYLVDNNSANGTFKEGQPVSAVRLQHGDRFQLGGEVEGLEGPWIAIHMPVAVHVTPPRSDADTLIARSPAPSLHVTQPGLSSAVSPSLAAVTPVASPPPQTPSSASQPYAYAAPAPSVDPTTAFPAQAIASRRAPQPPAAEVLDPQQTRRRDQLVRQIVGIALLLILACTVGVALGIRQGADGDAESAVRSE